MTLRLSASGVGYRVGGREVLREVSLALYAGDFACLLGPNGAGKTTLLRILAGVLAPSEGSVEVPTKAAGRIAYLVQTDSLPDDFYARDVVRLGRLPHRGLWQGHTRADDEAVDRAMAETGTAALADRRVGSLSGGERQRVALARALAQEPDILLLDEPTSHLDVAHRAELFAILRARAAAGIATLAVVHDVAFASHAPRAILLERGRVLADGPTREVLSGPLLERAFGLRFDALKGDDGRVVFVPALERPRGPD
ncbi:MAG TPA: ABC transporter ATP-binding protein [Polyangiaceae bacterium]|nr:ABC transporter ATP-binding protein [Polyangiaceae bacterium]